MRIFSGLVNYILNQISLMSVYNKLLLSSKKMTPNDYQLKSGIYWMFWYLGIEPSSYDRIVKTITMRTEHPDESCVCNNHSTCISVDSQMLLRWGKCLRVLSASCMYSSNPTTFISHALSPILTCIHRRGLGTHGLWLDQTYSSISLDLALPLLSWDIVVKEGNFHQYNFIFFWKIYYYYRFIQQWE